MSAKLQAIGLVLAVLLTGYLVGAASVESVRVWLETTVMGGM